MLIPKCAEVAVIGCGYWGKNLVRNFAQLGALRMVCDAAEMAPHAEVVANVDEVLSAPVEGVVIAMPAETHYELAKRALEAGKDVLCEKPLALTYERGAELVRLAERQGRILMVGHVLEYHRASCACWNWYGVGNWVRCSISTPTVSAWARCVARRTSH